MDAKGFIYSRSEPRLNTLHCYYRKSNMAGGRSEKEPYTAGKKMSASCCERLYPAVTMRPLHNCHYFRDAVSGSNFNPRNIQYIHAVEPDLKFGRLTCLTKKCRVLQRSHNVFLSVLRVLSAAGGKKLLR